MTNKTKELKNIWVVNQTFEITLIADKLIKTVHGSAALVIEAIEKNLLISARLVSGNVVENSVESGHAYIHMNDLPETFAFKGSYYIATAITNCRGVDTRMLVPGHVVIADIRVGSLLSVTIQNNE